MRRTGAFVTSGAVKTRQASQIRDLMSYVRVSVYRHVVGMFSDIYIATTLKLLEVDGMRKFGGSTTRFQLVSMIVGALVLGACSSGSSNGMSPMADAVTLSWNPPAENTNGTAVTDLAGYHIHYGTMAGDLTNVIDLAGTQTTTFEVSNLAPGTYYFAVSAYTTDGVESAESDIGSKTI